MDILPPPPADGTPLTTEALILPNMPPVPSFGAGALDLIPAVDTRDEPGDVPAPPGFDADDARRTLDRIADVLNGMKDRYERFWTSAGNNERTEALECAGWDIADCAYAEPELIQIFTRLTSMPAVLTRDHFRLLNVRQPDACNPADEACLRMRSERRPPREGWQVVPPSGDSGGETRLIDGLRDAMRLPVIGTDGRMGTDENGTPLFRTRADTLYPLYQKPPALPLSPVNP